MKNIVAFGASNSIESINQKLASWAAKQTNNTNVQVLDLNDYEMPIYSPQRERDMGIPQEAQAFKNTLNQADGIIISFAEYNGSYTSAFKNIFDWMSRISGSIWMDKPMLLLATSPGPRGAQTVLNTANTSFPYQGAKVAGALSLPSFHQNFDQDRGILNDEIKATFDKSISNFEQLLHSQEN